MKDVAFFRRSLFGEEWGDRSRLLALSLASAAVAVPVSNTLVVACVGAGEGASTSAWTSVGSGVHQDVSPAFVEV